jgi:hypothetical protein
MANDPTTPRAAPSRVLLSAALSALLWGPASGCVSDANTGTASSTTGTSSTSGSGGGTASGSGGGTTGDNSNVACDGGVSSSPTVTASSIVTDMTLASFTTQCDGRNGVVEIQPHCGGLNNCRGMSYDTGTQTLTEHTCRATNTCAGYTCVVCD